MANIRPDRIAKAIAEAPNWECTEILTGLLIEALPEMERGVYNFIKTHTQSVITSREIAEAFEVNMNYAGNILGRLRKWGLVVSEAKTGPNGLYYEWRAK